MMDEQTKAKLTSASVDYINRLCRIADEENYDRDSFIRAAVDMLDCMAKISTFEHYAEGGADREN